MYPREELGAEDKHWSKWSVKKLLGGRDEKSSLDFFPAVAIAVSFPLARDVKQD